MYQFLYLFGPGVLAWIVEGQRGGMAEEASEKNGIFVIAAKVIAYSMLDLAVTASVCKPFGRMQFVTLADGTLTVQYGASALAVAAAAAIIIGMCTAVLKKRSAVEEKMMP